MKMSEININMWRSKSLILISLFITLTLAQRRIQCSQNSTLLFHKSSIYDFSVRILYRVAHGRDGHFVYSPLSTWLQLVDLAEGAQGMTAEEIRKVTGYHTQLCYRRKLRQILITMYNQLKETSKLNRIVIFDKLLDVKHNYRHKVVVDNNLKILLLNFNRETNSSDGDIILPDDTRRTVDEVLGNLTSPLHYNEMLMIDNASYKIKWKYPFNPAQTKLAAFYNNGIMVGEVNMMSQIGKFNVTEIPLIQAKILELPCLNNDRVTMLFFLPTQGYVEEVFYKLRRTRLRSIFHNFETQALRTVNVSIPRFHIDTDIENLPELLNDMGIESMFQLGKANFTGITDYKMHASIMSQKTSIQVDEEGVNALVESMAIQAADFVLNRPFGFMLVDRSTHLIYLAGMYSIPEVH